MSIADILRSLREQSGLTLEEVGNKVGVSRQSMYKYESGRVTNIPSDKIAALAKVYGVSPGYIMGWEEDQDEEFYYLDKATRSIADEIKNNDKLSLLFDATRDAPPEDLETVHQMLLALKRKERHVNCKQFVNMGYSQLTI
jgi:transcriptional regulator with XRE-family HTH domain